MPIARLRAIVVGAIVSSACAASVGALFLPVSSFDAGIHGLLSIAGLLFHALGR